MTDETEKTTQSRPVEPMQVTIIGTGDGSRLPTGTEAKTEGEHQPNVVMNVVTPIMAMLVRGTKAFMVSWLGIMPVAGMTGIIPFTTFWDLTIKAAGLSVGVGVMASGNMFLEILTKLDQKFPTWTK